MDADQIEAKGDKLFDQSRHEEAKQCWDEAKRMRAKQKEEQNKTEQN
jgi:hypothetical protein